VPNSRRPVLFAAVVAIAIGGTPLPMQAGGSTILAIGDSMSEEYAFEVTFSAPESNPTAANTRNWLEILDQHRGNGSGADWLFFGSHQSTLFSYSDLRNAGFASNFGVPTFTTADWIEVRHTTNPLSNLLYYNTRVKIGSQIPNVSAVVIFLGGNDLKNDYTELFNDTLPDSFYTGIVDRIFELHDWLTKLDPDVKTVVCTVPDVGVTPSVYQTYHDPVKRAGARARIAAMNADLKSRAAALPGVKVADVHALTLRIEDEIPFKINGTPFTTKGAPENPPDRLFCRDDFHPSTSAQAIIADEILRALNRLLGTDVAPLANREILGDVLGLDPDQPYLDWIDAQNVGGAENAPHDNPDGDAFDNLAEFAFGLRAALPDPGLPAEFAASRLGILWHPNPDAEGYLDIAAEQSPDLVDWTPLPPDAITPVGDGGYRASIPAGLPRAFLRATVKPTP